MSFKKALEADKNIFMNEAEFATPVEYRFKSGGVKNISGVFSHQDGFDSRARSVGEAGLLVLWVSDVPKPEYGDLVVIDGEEWKVMPNIKGGDTSWVLEVSNNSRPRF